MLGVYDYTVVLTYVSLMVSVGGMMFAVNGHLHLGVISALIINKNNKMIFIQFLPSPPYKKLE